MHLLPRRTPGEFFVCVEIQYRIKCSLQGTTETFIGWAWCTKYSTCHNDETYISDWFIEILIQPYMYKKTGNKQQAVGGFLVGKFLWLPGIYIISIIFSIILFVVLLILIWNSRLLLLYMMVLCPATLVRYCGRTLLLLARFVPATSIRCWCRWSITSVYFSLVLWVAIDKSWIVRVEWIR